jgi:ABC-2 type transport system ATP-binding protein
VKQVIGLSPQDTAVADHLTVRENLEFMAAVYGCSKQEVKQRTDRIIGDFHLGEVENQRAQTLSGGWKRKLSIAMALISNPKVLFLDEPTLGLDVLARRELWREIEQLKGKMTIVLTTHYMEEAEHLSDRIAIMVSGRIAAAGSLAEILATGGADNLEDAFVSIAEKEGIA